MTCSQSRERRMRDQSHQAMQRANDGNCVSMSKDKGGNMLNCFWVKQAKTPFASLNCHLFYYLAYPSAALPSEPCLLFPPLMIESTCMTLLVSPVDGHGNASHNQHHASSSGYTSLAPDAPSLLPRSTGLQKHSSFSNVQCRRMSWANKCSTAATTTSGSLDSNLGLLLLGDGTLVTLFVSLAILHVDSVGDRLLAGRDLLGRSGAIAWSRLQRELLGETRPDLNCFGFVDGLQHLGQIVRIELG